MLAPVVVAPSSAPPTVWKMAKVAKEIHAEEVVKMDKFCAERNFTYDEIIEYFEDYPKGATIADIKAMNKNQKG